MDIILVIIKVYKLLGDSDQKKKSHDGRRINNPTRVLFGHELQRSITLTRYDLDFYSQILSVIKSDLLLKNIIDA